MKLKDCLCKNLKCEFCPYKSKKLLKICLSFKLGEPIKTPFNKIPSILRDEVSKKYDMEINENHIDNEGVSF